MRAFWRNCLSRHSLLLSRDLNLVIDGDMMKDGAIARATRRRPCSGSWTIPFGNGTVPQIP